MMYPFLTLDDNTVIVHSEMRKDGEVRVYVEKPDERDGFHHAVCMLPGYHWLDVFGFSEIEMNRYRKVIESAAHKIQVDFGWRLSYNGQSLTAEEET